MCAVLVLSGCASRVGGLPVADPGVTVEPAELTAELAFDDLTTVAPCSLTDPEVFDEFGDTSFATPESLDYCAISVTTSENASVVLSVGAFGELSAEPDLDTNRVEDLERGLWVGQQDDDPSFCSQLLVFPDDVTMQVSGSVYDGTADTCPMVEAGMAHAVEAILGEEVEHRDPEDDSLVTIDPCELVDDDEVGAVAGLTAARRTDDYPGKHTCFWEVPGTTVTVRVQFGAGVKPSAYGQGGSEGLVAGRQTATNKYPDVGDSSYCVVETAHLPFDEVEGEDAFEVAGVYVRMPAGQVEAGCAAARAVAEKVWPELPEA